MAWQKLSKESRKSNCRELDFCFIFPFFCVAVPLIIILFFGEQLPRFFVDDVSLTQFTLSPTSNLSVNMTFQNPPYTLFYNLAVNMTFRNPNRLIGIYFHETEVNAIYQGHRFATNEGIQGFYVGYKKGNNVSMVFKGQQLLLVNDADKLEYYSEDEDDHVYKIDVKLRIKMKCIYIIGKVHYDYNVICLLKVPLSTVSSAKFEGTECR